MNQKAKGVNAVDDLYKFMAFVAVIFGLALFLQIVRNRRYWVIMETTLGVMSLLSLPFAAMVIPNYQTTGTDSLVIYLFRIMALAKTSHAAVIFLTRNSRDPTVAIAISITNILTRAALLMSAAYGIIYRTTINQSALKIDMAMTVLYIIGDLFQLSKLTTREGSLTIGDPTSFHLSLDGLLTFMLASLVFGFSDMFVGIINPSHNSTEGQIALAQIFGCFLFGSAVLSFASLCFKNHEDGINVLKSKLLLYVPAVLLGFVNYLVDSKYRHTGYTTAVLGSMNVLAINAGYAVWQSEKEKVY